MAAPPTAPGLQNAVVVGLANESLTTDRDLRVKVQFPWQRDGRHAGPVNGQPESKAGDDGRTPGTDPVESFARPQLVPHSGQHPALGQPRLMTPKAVYDAAAQGIDIFLGWEDEGSIRNATPAPTVGDGKELSHTWVVRKIGQARITAEHQEMLREAIEKWRREFSKDATGKWRLSGKAPVDQIREVWPYAMRWAEEYAMFHEAHHLDPHNRGGVVPHAALCTEDYWTVVLRLLCFGLLTGHTHEVPRMMRFLDYGNELMGVRDGLIERLSHPSFRSVAPHRTNPPGTCPTGACSRSSQQSPQNGQR